MQTYGRSFIVRLSVALALFSTPGWSDTPGVVTKVPVVFSEGHDTDPVDRGRPVVLVAGALGVAPEVFRDAFSHVHPADPGVGPTGDEARQNKRALMSALGKYGITNDRLDTVSNRYRYVRSRDELWPVKAATAVALVKNGVVTGFEVSSGGYGYSSPPKVSVPGVKDFSCEVKLGFSKTFEKNGSVSGIEIKAASLR
jgi:hypothetical protein